MRAFLYLVIIISALSYGCKEQLTTLPYFATADMEPEWIKQDDSRFDSLHQVGTFAFMNQDSILVTNKDFDGGMYVTDFFFTTCPSICPEMTDNMASLQARFLDNDRIKFLSHTVTPWIDTVRQLKKYAIEKEVISGKWHLVTGPQEQLYAQARNAYFVEGRMGLRKGEDDFLHTENFVLVGPQRHIRGIYNGTSKSDIQRLIEDMEILKTELK